jgi:CBS domain-containing protein
VIAAFVWIAGTQEAQLELARSALHGVAVRDAMVRDFVAVSPDTEVAHAAGLLARGFQRAFPVVRENRLIGVVTPRAIFGALTHSAPTTPLGDIMDRRFAMADPAEPLAEALARLPGDGSPVVIAKDGDVLGLLDAAHVEDALAMRA